MALWQQHCCCGTTGQCTPAVLYMKRGTFSQMRVSRVLWCIAIYHVVVDIACLCDLGVDLWLASWWVHHCGQNFKPSLGRFLPISPWKSQAEHESVYVCTLESGASRNVCGEGYPLEFVSIVRHIIFWAGMAELSWLPRILCVLQYLQILEDILGLPSPHTFLLAPLSRVQT